VRDGSAHRHGSWWAIKDSGIAAGECDQLFRDYPDASKTNWSRLDNVREWSGQGMEGAASIMQIKRAVVVIGIGGRQTRSDIRVSVARDRRGLIHIQGMVVDQRDHADHLRDHEERQ
jgi:hypothetical protein